jgi:hypothetical protein
MKKFYKGKKILITGGAGYIGQLLIGKAHTTTLGKVENRPDFLPGRAQVECCLPNISLLRGIYLVDVGINSKEGFGPIGDIKNAAQFAIVELADNYQMVRSTGYFAPPSDWRFEGDNVKENGVL